MSKLLVFLGTLITGLIITCGPVMRDGFTTLSVREWVMDGLLVAAVLGFALTKFLEFKGIWEKPNRGGNGDSK